MREKRYTPRLTHMLLCLVLVLSLLPIGAAAADSENVRVGFFAFDGYHMQDDSGVRSGYGYDIVQYMSGYTELHFEFTGYDASWSEAQDMLERGEIDMLTSAQKTPEREARFDFSEHPIGTSSAMLTVRAGNMTYILEDYANWSGMRVGMINGNSRNDRFDEFAKEHGFTYSPVYFEDTDKMLAELQSGSSIDAVVTSNLRRSDGEWILAQFAASPFYVMVQKGNTALLEDIDSALAMLYDAMPEIDDLLMQKYYLTEDGSNIAFTVEEIELIEASKETPISVGVITNTRPVCYIGDDGEFKGVSMEILQAVSSKTGLVFDYHSIDLAGNSPIGWLRSGEYDLVSGILKSEEFKNDPTLTLSGDLLPDSLVMIVRKADGLPRDSKGGTIAVLAGFQVGQEYVERQFQQHNILVLSSFEDCLRAVVTGKADAMVHLRSSASFTLQNPHYETLEIAPAYSQEVSTGMAGLSSDAAAIVGIVNKGLAMMSFTERSAIMMEYTVPNPYTLTLGDMIYKYRATISVVVLMLLVVIASLIAVIYTRRKSAYKLQAAYEQATAALAVAEKANASKSQFLSRVSHEMRTPLNAIIGFLELSKGADSRKLESNLANCMIAARQLVSVINDVLDMSSIESGKMKLANEPFDFRQLIYSVTNIYVAQCHAKGIAYDTKLATTTDEWLSGDQLRVNQILINLLGNAVKFTSTGHVRLTVSQLKESAERVYIRFEVTDTGCGMSEAMLERLFTPFEQEDAATAQRYGGSGLGLSIVKSLVSLMDGAIKVESKRGVGSTFTVDLPFGRCEESHSVPQLDGVDELRVLAVDDDPTERDYVSVVLNRIGVRYTCVSGGDEALGVLSSAEESGDPFTICLVDWKMPDMDGAETTRRIRSKYGQDVIVIVVSAYDHEQANDTAIQAGANLFIPKPLFQSSLFDLFMTLTGGRITKREATIADYRFEHKRLLLVEDNEMNRMVAGAIIEQMGMSFEEAADGQIACDMFAASPPGYYDAILMDMQMPNVGGLEATEIIRASDHPSAKTVQIIALTANAFDEDITRILSAGMNAHVAKPIDIDDLAKALNNAFKANDNSGEKTK